MKTSKLILGLFMTSLIVGCSDDDDGDVPPPVNEEETITTMNVTLTAPSGEEVTLRSFDEDGNGPDAPELTVSGPLAANTVYSGEVELLNQTEDPAENVTNEIREEANVHQFFFAQSGLNADFEYADMETDYPEPEDDNNSDPFNDEPVGIEFTMSTGEASNGTVTITLVHEPMKDAEGVSDGNIENAGGEEDFVATFDVSIE